MQTTTLNRTLVPKEQAELALAYLDAHTKAVVDFIEMDAFNCDQVREHLDYISSQLARIPFSARKSNQQIQIENKVRHTEARGFWRINPPTDRYDYRDAMPGFPLIEKAVLGNRPIEELLTRVLWIDGDAPVPA